MTNVPIKKVVTKSNPIIPVVAGMVGAMVGGVAVATSMIMGDRKNRQKVKDAFNDKKTEVKDKVINEVKKI